MSSNAVQNVSLSPPVGEIACAVDNRKPLKSCLKNPQSTPINAVAQNVFTHACNDRSAVQDNGFIQFFQCIGKNVQKGLVHLFGGTFFAERRSVRFADELGKDIAYDPVGRVAISDQMRYTQKVKTKRLRPDLPLPDVSFDSVPFTRAYPPLSIIDTIKRKRGPDEKIVYRSIHGKAHSFQNHEITRVLARFSPPPAITIASNGKAVLQQQATRGCTAACAAMLLADHGKPVDWDVLRYTNLGDDETKIRVIEEGGLCAKTRNVTSKEDLRAVLRDGPAIISVDTGCGGHVIVLDSISPDFATAIVRDPYHGWQIEVTGYALEKAIGGRSRIIQIAK